MHRWVNVAPSQQGPALDRVNQLVLNHHGLKRQFASVGLHGEVEARPASLKSLLAQFFGSISKLERAVHRPTEERHGNHAVSVHFDHGTVSEIGHGFHPVRPRWKREEVGDDHACLLSQLLHDGRSMTFPCEVEHVAKTLFFEPPMQIHCCIHHHVVMAQRCVRVAFVQSVVNQQGAPVVMSHPPSDVDGRVFLGSKQRFQPHHNRSFTHGRSVFSVPSAPLTKVFGQVHKTRPDSPLIYPCSTPKPEDEAARRIDASFIRLLQRLLPPASCGSVVSCTTGRWATWPAPST